MWMPRNDATRLIKLIGETATNLQLAATGGFARTRENPQHVCDDAIRSLLAIGSKQIDGSGDPFTELCLVRDKLCDVLVRVYGMDPRADADKPVDWISDPAVYRDSI
jgi:hypothetical protein